MAVVETQQAVDFVLVEDAGGFRGRHADVGRSTVAVAAHHGFPLGGQLILFVAVAALTAAFAVTAHGGFPFGGHRVLIVSRARHSSIPLRVFILLNQHFLE